MGKDVAKLSNNWLKEILFHFFGPTLCVLACTSGCVKHVEQEHVLEVSILSTETVDINGHTNSLKRATEELKYKYDEGFRVVCLSGEPTLTHKTIRSVWNAISSIGSFDYYLKSGTNEFAVTFGTLDDRSFAEKGDLPKTVITINIAKGYFCFAEKECPLNSLSNLIIGEDGDVQSDGVVAQIICDYDSSHGDLLSVLKICSRIKKIKNIFVTSRDRTM